MKLSEIPEGQTIEMTVYRESNFEIAKPFKALKVYKTKVVSSKESVVEVLAPLMSSPELNIKEDESIEITYTTDIGLMKWECNCIGDKYEGIIPLLLLNGDLIGEKHNRRDGFRVSCSQDITYTNMISQEEFSGTMLDISSLGACIKTKSTQKENDIFTINYVINSKSFSTIVRIARIGKCVDDETEYGMRFLEPASESLSKAICKLQLEEIRKRRYSRQ